MMSIAPTSALPHSIPNTSPTDLSDVSPQTNNKKRRREDERGVEDDGDRLKEKKKKKKRHRASDSAQYHIEETSTQADPTLSASTAASALPLPHKKKSKKKDKGKQPSPAQSTEPIVQINRPSSPSSNSQASAAALISAIVAAAAGTPDSAPHQSQALSQPQFPPHMAHPPSEQQQYMYPLMQYGYNIPPYMPHNAMDSSALFPPPSLPFSELAFGSNEDVLRALQAIDMSKITNVLKSLGEAAAAANNSGQPSLSEAQAHLTPVGQVPVASGTILGIVPKESSNGHHRTLDMSLPGTEHHTNPDHACLLATKWLNAGKLSELVKTEGLVYKKGKFSAIEEQQLKTAMEGYRISRQLTEEQMLDLIFPKVDKNKDNAFWSEITAAVPQRPIIAVYHHVRRSYHPWKQQGKWLPGEDDMLKQAVADLGQQWEKVSERVGRMSSDCRDRYRNHIVNKDIRVTGPWTKKEEEDLTRIVTEMTVKQGRDVDNDVFWGRVSELMGGTRGRQQCRIKWTDALSKTIKNEGQKPRWGQQDAYILVHKIDSLNVRDDTEIDWKTLSDPQWNLWSAHTLQRRWLTMKRGIKGYEDITHQEIMDIIRVKKAQLPAAPPVSSRKRKERKVVSAAAIKDSDLQRDSATSVPVEPETSASSGSLTGTGLIVRDKDADGSTDTD